MALESYGPIELWPYAVMACIVMADVVMALYSYGRFQFYLSALYSYSPVVLWPYSAMALYGCGPI